MKIGILTLPQKTNYGGLLQAFALQKVLRDMGHEVVTINRYMKLKKRPFIVQLISYLKRLASRFIFRKEVTTAWNPSMPQEVYTIISRKTQSFQLRNTKMTRVVFPEQLGALDEEYQFNAYVVGSDQVWLEKYCPNSFLDFVRRTNVKKVAYAASAGKQSVFDYPEKVALCKPLANGFDAISVREDYLVGKCKEQFGIDAKWVLDPTMLLSPSDYLDVVEEDDNKTPIVFSYILDKNRQTESITDIVAKELNLPVVQGNVELEYKKIKNIDLEKCTFPSVDSWINGINRAKFVITDSFHGTVFAILFNKQFVSIANNGRGYERFRSLLSMFHLENRLILSFDDKRVNELMTSFVDYSEVNSILFKYRSDSLLFLKDSLL